MALPVAIVTGTARTCGIGRACARAFVREGYRVLGVDKSGLEQRDGLEEGADFISSYHHLVVDLSSPSEVTFIPAAVQQHFGQGPVQVLVNNAGKTGWLALHDMHQAIFQGDISAGTARRDRGPPPTAE